MKQTIRDTISVYFKDYADAPMKMRSDPSPAAIRILRKSPELSFEEITNCKVPLPDNLDPRDSGDPIFRLLLAITDLVPELIIPRMTEGYSGTRSFYIQCAAVSELPIFIPTIIDLLSDRSILIKTLVLSLIVKWPHLRVPEAIPKLEKLSKMKSLQKYESDRALLEKAKETLRINR